ncbi:MAG: hypothetical protein LC723_09715 [Actinobacteria bacterium]|nr:hypothetical protein [Actinomycetota bacterium]
MTEATSTSTLEAEIRSLPGVISAVMLDDGSGNHFEIQVFVREGTSEHEIRRQIAEQLSVHGRMQATERIYVFELSGDDYVKQSNPVAPIAVAPAPEPPSDSASKSRRAESRPSIGKILLTSTGPTAQAQVKLLMNGVESEGVGTGRKTSYSLRVVAATTLEAAQAFIGQKGVFALEGVSLIEVLGQRVVISLVHSAIGDGRLMVGACLVGSTPVHEATVRATLDAVNRQLGIALD